MLATPPYFDEQIWGTDTWPLLSAAYTGDLDTVSRMLDANSSLIQAQFAYYGPLHYAVMGGSAAMVQLLLQYGAHPGSPGWQTLGDESPIGKALDMERPDLVALLQQAGGKMPAYTPPTNKEKTEEQKLLYDFQIACGYAPNRSLVEEILATHPDWASKGVYEAVHHGQMEMLQFLLAAGADLNADMPFACWLTPLMHSLRFPQPRWEIAQLLLDNGIAVNGVNGLGISALHLIVLQGTTAAAEWLLARGADVDQLEPWFCSTPLGWAAKYGRPEMAKLLLKHGADASLPHHAAWATPLRWAEKKNHPDLVQILKG